MDRINEELYNIKLKMNERQRLESILRNTLLQLEELKKRKKELLSKLGKEENDVKKLEGISFANLIHIIAGDKAERLEKEKQEALSAKLKYDEVNAEVNNLSDEVEKIKRTLSDFGDLDSRYMELINEKEKLMDSKLDRELQEIIEEKADLKTKEKELHEALDAGRDLLDSLERVDRSLDSASSWGTWDMLGGGLLTDMVKHSRIDEARSEIDHAQSLLRRFQRELMDVGGSTNISIDIGSFMTFADYFFDGIFVDWAVQSRINDAKARVEDTLMKVRSIVSRIENEIKNITLQLDELEKKRIRIIEQA